MYSATYTHIGSQMRAICVQDVHDASKGPEDSEVLSYTSLARVQSRGVNKNKPLMVHKYKTKHEAKYQKVNKKWTESITNKKVKVKQSRYRPGVAQRVPDFMTRAQDGGKVVSLTHRPLLPPGNTPGTHFCLRLSRTQGHSASGRILCQWIIQWHQLGSNQLPSDLQHSTLTTVLRRSPQ